MAGVEPATSCLCDRCSSILSYTAYWCKVGTPGSRTPVLWLVCSIPSVPVKDAALRSDTLGGAVGDPGYRGKRSRRMSSISCPSSVRVNDVPLKGRPPLIMVE